MKLLLKNTRLTWRAGLGVLIGAAAMAAAACAGGGTTSVSPSGVAPFDQHAGPGTPVRNFTVTMTGTSLTAPGGTLHVTVTNTGSGAAALGAVKLTLQSGLTPVSATNFQSVSGSKNWILGVSPIVSPDVIVGGAPGNNKLDPGDAISFDLAVTSSICDSYSITSVGSNDTPESLTDTSFTSNQWTNTAGAVTVTVTGCIVTCTDRHAPAIAQDYWMNVLDLPANDPRHGGMSSEAGQRTSDDGSFTYNGQTVTPCQHPAYENLVKAFVDDYLAAHPLS